MYQMGGVSYRVVVIVVVVVVGDVDGNVVVENRSREKLLDSAIYHRLFYKIYLFWVLSRITVSISTKI